MPVDRFPTFFPSSSSVRRVRAPLRNAGHRRRGSSGDHHGYQPRTEVTSAWRHAGRRRYDGARHAGGARERQMSAPPGALRGGGRDAGAARARREGDGQVRVEFGADTYQRECYEKADVIFR